MLVAIDRDPSKNKLQSFSNGVVFILLCFTTVFNWNFLITDWEAFLMRSDYFIYSSIVVFIVGRVVPIFLRPIYFFWQRVSLVMGVVIGPAILLLIYFSVFTPLGCILRLFKASPMRQTIDLNGESFWQKIPMKTNSDFDRMW